MHGTGKWCDGIWFWSLNIHFAVANVFLKPKITFDIKYCNFYAKNITSILLGEMHAEVINVRKQLKLPNTLSMWTYLIVLIP